VSPFQLLRNLDAVLNPEFEPTAIKINENDHPSSKKPLTSDL